MALRVVIVDGVTEDFPDTVAGLDGNVQGLSSPGKQRFEPTMAKPTKANDKRIDRTKALCEMHKQYQPHKLRGSM